MSETLFDHLDVPSPPVLEVADEADRAALVALAMLPKIGLKALWKMLAADRPSAVWDSVRAGRLCGLAMTERREHWQPFALRTDPLAVLARHETAGIEICPHGSPETPPMLSGDPDPAPVLFMAGPARSHDRRCVAIVGTRRCTAVGREVAYELGLRLAERGVDVVSGLALGIDAAAHRGALAGRDDAPVAVVASGFDVVYPPSNRDLWQQVRAKGRLVSEWPLGSRPDRWRFPARNRLIAGLSEMVIVVESGESGGSMYTVDEALRRDRRVAAVPGLVRSPASMGTNRLIVDGAEVIWSVEAFVDQLVPAPVSSSRPRASPGPVVESWLLDALGWRSAAIEQLAHRTGRPLADVQFETERLIATGLVERRGSVIERRA